MRRCSPCGTPVTRPCVRTCDPAGEMWTGFNSNAQKGETICAGVLKKRLPIFSYTDVSTSTSTVPSAPTSPRLRFLLFPDTATTNLSYPKTQNLTHLSTPDPLCPPIKRRAQAWSKSRRWGLVWCGSMEDSRAAHHHTEMSPA